MVQVRTVTICDIKIRLISVDELLDTHVGSDTSYLRLKDEVTEISI